MVTHVQNWHPWSVQLHTWLGFKTHSHIVQRTLPWQQTWEDRQLWKSCQSAFRHPSTRLICRDEIMVGDVAAGFLSGERINLYSGANFNQRFISVSPELRSLLAQTPNLSFLWSHTGINSPVQPGLRPPVEQTSYFLQPEQLQGKVWPSICRNLNGVLCWMIKPLMFSGSSVSQNVVFVDTGHLA